MSFDPSEVPMHRHPAVAGYFYQGTAEALRKQVQGFIISGAKRVKALGILVPHAGFMYSGAVAGAVYSSVELPDTFILIGPNHTGRGPSVSLMSSGRWETPLGTVEIDEHLAAAILDKSSHIEGDTLAHLREHSLEVQLPFIQYFKHKFKIVPLQMLDTRLETCLEVGGAIAEAVKERGARDAENESKLSKVLIVASSDMSHYEPAAMAKEKDSKAVHQILNLDPEGLFRTVRQYGITMCGYVPAVVMLASCNALGASHAELIKYANSGDVSGDYDQVVGYAGIIIM